MLSARICSVVRSGAALLGEADEPLVEARLRESIWAVVREPLFDLLRVRILWGPEINGARGSCGVDGVAKLNVGGVLLGAGDESGLSMSMAVCIETFLSARSETRILLGWGISIRGAGENSDANYRCSRVLG